LTAYSPITPGGTASLGNRESGRALNAVGADFSGAAASARGYNTSDRRVVALRRELAQLGRHDYRDLVGEGERQVGGN
jgi:hypothetical protein